MCTSKEDLHAAVSMMNIHFAKLNSAMNANNFSAAAAAINALAYEAKHATGLVAKVTIAQASTNQRR
ncbi:MAG TPA: hypothetical protein VL995_21060 [Cellvibrio sp.]|nr:hypothetical protein [Cellvibrio sp.]